MLASWQILEFASNGVRPPGVTERTGNMRRTRQLLDEARNHMAVAARFMYLSEDIAEMMQLRANTLKVSLAY